jgi:hypothetical protein
VPAPVPAIRDAGIALPRKLNISLSLLLPGIICLVLLASLL